MRTLESIIVGLGLLFVAVGTVLTVGPQALVNMAVYPVVGVALVLAVAFGGEWIATAWRRSGQRLRLMRANRTRAAHSQTPDMHGWSVG